jgi:hypothetical protein
MNIEYKGRSRMRQYRHPERKEITLPKVLAALSDPVRLSHRRGARARRRARLERLRRLRREFDAQPPHEGAASRGRDLQSRRRDTLLRVAAAGARRRLSGIARIDPPVLRKWEEAVASDDHAGRAKGAAPGSILQRRGRSFGCPRPYASAARRWKLNARHPAHGVGSFEPARNVGEFVHRSDDRPIGSGHRLAPLAFPS